MHNPQHSANRHPLRGKTNPGILAGLLLLTVLACAGCGGGSGGATVVVSSTRTPIKHLIIVIPENRSFDNVFATYTPPPGQTVWNLLSRGIIKADGSPG